MKHMVIYVTYKVPFYLRFKFFSFAWGYGYVFMNLKQRKLSFKIELNHNIILHMNYILYL